MIGLMMSLKVLQQHKHGHEVQFRDSCLCHRPPVYQLGHTPNDPNFKPQNNVGVTFVSDR